MPDVNASYGTPFNFIAFFCIFSYNIIDHSCLNCCISTKLSLIVCLINAHISVNVNIPEETASYGMPLAYIAFFDNFAHI